MLLKKNVFFPAENEAVYNLLGIKKKKKVRKVMRGFKYIYKELLLIKVIYSSKDAEYKYLVTFFTHMIRNKNFYFIKLRTVASVKYPGIFLNITRWNIS